MTNTQTGVHCRPTRLPLDDGQRRQLPATEHDAKPTNVNARTAGDTRTDHNAINDRLHDPNAGVEIECRPPNNVDTERDRY